jgi:hypothetical protein
VIENLKSSDKPSVTVSEIPGPSVKVSKLLYQESRKDVTKFDKSFGELVKDLNLRFLKRWTITTFILFDFARRLIMAIIIVHVDIYPWAQLMIVMYLNQAYMMFTIYHKVYADPKQRMISNLNEIITLLTIYHLFCFTNFVPDAETQYYYVGNSMIMMTYLNLVINLGPIVPQLYSQVTGTTKKKLTVYRIKKARKAKQQLRKNRVVKS